ncbi:EAL domain-containing protein [Paraburkholderia bryophila]|uniref:sensor domain-containing protein n=1 Tax=Paraburkholderia bryophila TaxID=420952 RepID=UPI00234BAB8E|nr:EAL domain-containing protein [Paraburkholderia bryophila]WCM23608.1 EAL domain-containing protein [Paraburkholderia bryophila]
MAKLHKNRTLSGHTRQRDVARKILTAVAVAFILAAIGMNTFLAHRQTREQENSLGTLRESGRLKHDLDDVQQMMLDEHGELYTLVSTRPFYKRAPYYFPVAALLDLTSDARSGCAERSDCISHLNELDDMLRRLGERSNTLASRANQHPGSVNLGDPALSEIDAYFYSVLGHVVDVRMEADATIDSVVTKSSSNASWSSSALVISGFTAGALLLCLIVWNSRIAQRLRVALRLADAERARYQRFFDEHPLPIWIYDNASLNIIAANGAAQRGFGYQEAELLGMSLKDIHPEEEFGGLKESFSRKSGTTVGETQAVGVWIHQTKSGERKSMDVHRLNASFEGRPATMSVMVDVTLELAARAELFESKQTLEYVLDHIPQGIAWKNAKHLYVGGNEIYARDAGLPSREALIGVSDHDLLWGADANQVQDEDVRVMAGELSRRHFERTAIAVDGTEVWISETKLPLEDQKGNTVGVLIAYENITGRRKSELALRLQGRAIDASINGIVIAEVQPGRNIVMFANPAFERITGYSSSDVTGADCESLFALAGEPQKWAEVRDAMDRNAEANVTLSCIRKNGERFWNNVLVAPVRNEHGYVTHHVGVMSDVTALFEYQARLEHQARYDALTNLPNRTLLDERLSEAIQLASEAGSHVSVMFLDLDRFKEVNDSLGHRVGDALLANVAKRLQRLFRSNDLVARYGGDEFIIVVACSGGEQLVPMLERVIAAMNEPFHAGERELYVEASIGVCTYPQDGDDADTLIRNADAAMYLAKSRGRNGYQFYRPELNLAATERLEFSNRLRRAVKAKSLYVAYQPQIDMVTGRIFGAEALLRWHDAELGAVSPALFIPIAEETGLIQGLDEWVLRTACEQATRWREQGLPAIRVSVNVSPLQFERSDLVSAVRSALSDTGCRADMLELEVTEGALMRNAEDASRVLHSLRLLGVTIAIDDFGTGYSSLSYLKRFSVDRIKIDKAFVQEIGRSTEYEAITLAVIAIAEALKFDVIAEGVETDLQRDFLVEHGCKEGQGFLYSAAVSGEAIAAMLQSSLAPARIVETIASMQTGG